MTRQQTQQQTQENNLLDLEETESVNKDAINTKDSKKKESVIKRKQIAVQVNTFTEREPSDCFERAFDFIYSIKCLDCCCKWLSKKVCKKAKDTTWIIVILSAFFAISLLNVFISLFPNQ